MEDLAKVIKGFDDEKRKKLFTDLTNAQTIEGVMSVGSSYNLNITKEQAAEVYEGLKNTDKLSKEELASVAAGGMHVMWIFCLM